MNKPGSNVTTFTVVGVSDLNIYFRLFMTCIADLFWVFPWKKNGAKQTIISGAAGRTRNVRIFENQFCGCIAIFYSKMASGIDLFLVGSV